MILYGLETCPLCQKAQKALIAAGKDVSFRDIRSEPLTEAELSELLAEFGDRLVDRTTNDWRSLSAWLKNSEAEDQLSAKPRLMARPVIKDGSAYFLGWDDAVERELIGA